MNESFLKALVVVAAYFVGSISSAWLVVKLVGKYDMRGEPDGTISAASVYYRLGAAPYAAATLIDIAIGASVVLLARAVTHSTPTAMLAGLSGMAGHNWSAYLRFKGGQGATSMAGALLALMPLPLLFGLVTAFITSQITRRHGAGTAVGVLAISLVALLSTGPGVYAVYPLSLLSLMLVKRLQLARSPGHGSLGSAK